MRRNTGFPPQDPSGLGFSVPVVQRSITPRPHPRLLGLDTLSKAQTGGLAHKLREEAHRNGTANCPTHRIYSLLSSYTTSPLVYSRQAQTLHFTSPATHLTRLPKRFVLYRPSTSSSLVFLSYTKPSPVLSFLEPPPPPWAQNEVKV